jgi:hypothetical protein
MIITLDDLTKRLDANRSLAEMGDTSASDALWIKLLEGKVQRKEEFRSPDGNSLLQVHLNANGELLGLEIFP